MEVKIVKNIPFHKFSKEKEKKEKAKLEYLQAKRKIKVFAKIKKIVPKGTPFLILFLSYSGNIILV
jgi:hypothetical protein